MLKGRQPRRVSSRPKTHECAGQQRDQQDSPRAVLTRNDEGPPPELGRRLHPTARPARRPAIGLGEKAGEALDFFSGAVEHDGDGEAVVPLYSCFSASLPSATVYSIGCFSRNGLTRVGPSSSMATPTTVTPFGA